MAMLHGQFSPHGFQVTANSALELVVGTQVASAGFVDASVNQGLSRLGSQLRGQLGMLDARIAAEGSALQAVNADGFAQLNESLHDGVTDLGQVALISAALQAASLHAATKQLRSVEKGVRRVEVAVDQLREAQQLTTRVLADVRSLVERTVQTGERMLDAMLNSRAVEARQLFKQALDNLNAGYPEQAIERLTRSLDYDNTLFATHGYLTQLYAARNDLPKAINHAERAARFAQSESGEVAAFAAMQHAGLLRLVGQYPRALAESARAIGLRTSTDAEFLHVELLAENGKPAEASQALEALLRRTWDSGDECGKVYVAALASPALSAIAPAHVRILANFDANQRATCLALLDQAQQWLDLTEKNTFGPHERDGSRTVGRDAVEQLRQQVLSVEFTGLRSVATACVRVQEQAGAACRSQIVQSAYVLVDHLERWAEVSVVAIGDRRVRVWAWLCLSGALISIGVPMLPLSPAAGATFGGLLGICIGSTFAAMTSSVPRDAKSALGMALAATRTAANSLRSLTSIQSLESGVNPDVEKAMNRLEATLKATRAAPRVHRVAARRFGADPGDFLVKPSLNTGIGMFSRWRTIVAAAVVGMLVGWLVGGEAGPARASRSDTSAGTAAGAGPSVAPVHDRWSARGQGSDATSADIRYETEQRAWQEAVGLRQEFCACTTRRCRDEVFSKVEVWNSQYGEVVRASGDESLRRRLDAEKAELSRCEKRRVR
jgi:tetratricopeptide (TPR) repeat protein